MLLQKCLDEGDIGPEDEKRFYRSVRAFYIQAFEYALKHLPIDDDLLKNSSFLDFKLRENSTISQVEYFVERYISNLLIPLI